MRIISRAVFFAAVAASLTALTGCIHIQVTEKDFIRPDRLTGYQAKEAMSNEWLQTIKPGAQVQEKTIVVDDMLKLNGLSLQVDAARPTVLYFGGNLSHADESLKSLARQTSACTPNFVSFDYRGYGRTKGEPSIKSLQEDALRIYDEVRKNTQGKLFLHGQSLGSFMTGHIMQNRSVDGVILEATATTLPEVVSFKTPWYAVPFVRFSYEPSTLLINNAKAVSQYQQKSLVIVGENDDLFGFELGKKVFDAMPSANKQLLLVKNGPHSGMMNKAEVQQAFCSFINTGSN